MKYFARFENISPGDDGHPQTPALAGPFADFIQLTHALLRSGPDGDPVANLITYSGKHKGCWEYQGDFYSDVVIYAEQQ